MNLTLPNPSTTKSELRRSQRVGAGLLLAATLFTACAPAPQDDAVVEQVAILTPAPTPTATAVLLSIADAAPAPRTAPPAPAAGAPCGFVDTLDAPLRPPDGLGAGVRWPYGRQSRRYGGKYHAGEDWGLRNGQNLGEPVHAIGHGRVVYSAPLGWGRDQGVLIVEHAFDDGDRVLSFYGHLDPPSVTLPVGGCVLRGQTVGNIGDPVTRPHLHFEIREHMATEPGPGYWPRDPVEAGWHPPSEFIWTHRVSNTPGVAWARAVTEPLRAALGPTIDGTIVAQPDGQRLLGLAARDGSLRWRLDLARPMADVALDTDNRTLYLVDRLGAVAALDLTGAAVEDPAVAGAWLRRREGPATPPSVRWVDVDAPGNAPTLLALPAGGVVVHAGAALRGLWPDGRPGWRLDDVASAVGQDVSGRWFVRTVDELGRGLRRRDLPASGPGEGLRLVEIPMPGQPAVAGDRVFVHHDRGVWSARLDGPDVARRHELPPGALEEGEVLALPDGGALVAHRGVTDRRLLRLDADGGLVWDRRIDHLDPRLPRLLRTSSATGPEARLITAASEVLRIDLGLGEATRIFAGGTRVSGGPFLAPPQALSDGTLLVHLQAGGPSGLLVALAPEPAPLAD